MTFLTRRRVCSLPLALAACRSGRPPGPSPAVSIVKAADYEQAVYQKVREILAEHRVDARGKRVVLKPNLVEFSPGTSINTHPLLVHAALEAFKAAGAAEVRIAEGPGHRRLTLDLADSAGYFKLIPGFERLFTDLNTDEVARVELRRPLSKLTSLYLPKTVLGCDLLVSLPKLKTHHWVGATLSLKNFFGVVPGAVYGWPKNVLHWAGIEESIADIANALPPQRFAIVDGIDGMEGNGPIQGRPKHAGVLVAGHTLAAVDATCCRIMGLEPRNVRYLALLAGSNSFGEETIRQIGEPVRAVRSRFDLLPELEWMRRQA